MASQEDKTSLVGKELVRSPTAHTTENTRIVLQLLSEDVSEDWGMGNLLALYLDMGSCLSKNLAQCHSSAAILVLCEASLSFSSLHPGDLYPFTRKPLFIIVDSSNSVAYKVRLLKAGTGLTGYSVNP